MKDRLEFYLSDSRSPFLIMDSAFQPSVDDYISIKGDTFKVVGRSFAVDYAELHCTRQMRLNVIVEKVPKAGKIVAGERTDV